MGKLLQPCQNADGKAQQHDGGEHLSWEQGRWRLAGKWPDGRRGSRCYDAAVSGGASYGDPCGGTCGGTCGEGRTGGAWSGGAGVVVGIVAAVGVEVAAADGGAVAGCVGGDDYENFSGFEGRERW